MKTGDCLRFVPLSVVLAASLCLIAWTGMAWGSSDNIQPGVAADLVSGDDVDVTGEVTVLFIDDFDRKSAEVLYQIKDSKSGKVFSLHFTGDPPGKLRTGSVVRVRGKAKGEEIHLLADGSGQLQDIAPSAPAVAGEQRTIVIVANFLDASVACSVTDVQNRVFADPLNKSVDDLYREMSFGQLWLTGSVVGPFPINYTTTSACDIAAWASAADAAASAHGVNLSAYNRKIYVLPRTNPCNYTGVGTVGGNPSRSWIFRCDINDTYAHEIGHNLGMHHASTPANEYGDTSDIMGYGGFGLRQINGPHQDQTGWLNSAQMKGVVGSGTFTIAPIELDAAQASAPQVLIVPKPDTAENYYLSYRQPLGFDTGLSSAYLTGVNIHRHKTDSATQTYFLSALSDGQSFTDSINSLTVTQITHANSYVTVQIQMNPAPICTVSGPMVNIAPAAQSAYAGSTASYTVTVTNMDSIDCQMATFALNASVPSGWTGSVSPATLTLVPGAAATATLTALSTASAAAGDYAVTVGLSDAAAAAHTASRTATYTVIVAADTTSPSTPAGLTAKVVRGKVNLAWTASVDNVGVAGYRVWRNNAAVAQITGTSYTDTAVSSGQTYTYFVTAFDAAGNASAASSPVTITVAGGAGGKKR